MPTLFTTTDESIPLESGSSYRCRDGTVTTLQSVKLHGGEFLQSIEFKYLYEQTDSETGNLVLCCTKDPHPKDLVIKLW